MTPMMQETRYNKTFEEAQDYLSKIGFDIPWNDCDVWVDKDNLTETVANVIQWANDNMIEKAAQWLDENIDKYVMEGRENKPYVSIVLADDFKQAMMK